MRIHWYTHVLFTYWIHTYATISLPLGLENQIISQISCHPAGRHYLCCSTCGGAWSWGAGDDGRLGHGDTAPRDAPSHLHHLAHHEVVRVAAGAACRYDLKLIINIIRPMTPKGRSDVLNI